MTERSKSGRAEGLLGSGALYSLSTVAPVIVSLLITPLITRALGAEGYGVVGIGITLYQFGSIALGLGLSTAITRHAIIAGTGVSGATALVWCGAALSVVGGGLAVALLPFWGGALLGDAGDATALIWPTMSAVALSILTLCQSVFRAVSRVKTFVALGMLSALAGPLIGLMAVSAGPADSGAYLCGLAVGHTLAAMTALALLPRIPRTAFSLAELRGGLALGLPTVPHSITGALVTIVLVACATQLEGIAAGGRLQLALFLGSAPMLILGAFNNSWAPMVFRQPDTARSDFLARSLQAISVLVLTLVALFCTLLEPVARFIAGPELYDESLRAAALIACAATPLMALYLVNIHLVFLRGRTLALAATTPVSGAIGIAASLAALSLWPGYPAAIALGLPVFHGCQALWAWWLSSRTGYPPTSVVRSLPALVAALALIAATLCLQLPLLALALVGLLLIAGAALFNRRAIRQLR
ncbi:lipopolysaccharide biosynthesis protein [Microbacterium algeriense]|uniref:Oligosaccharide flippase family protein n=1 Tax=Microbacterium algeriense TaxID=2615184 RepID=A0ABQ6V9P4_9MICO|nr:oligosaccharide flippase family protein [Microbacterium algeriense]KAB1867110.1 oligosaccharide flippase family protein [Microbacterium algeriense]